ncbi:MULTISPECIES: hypothetical protein [Caldilinea]|jgi:hypothetical protein|uniref:hypothetical protein n=1 Tax=Caldilinea TaxID=233191 RepID=UPI000300BC2A|nr:MULTISPECIES: hypothetical protein [Caldilinea]MBO9391505.1 hypothetical protein [Caldilinea sp.]GIV75206.1 MAG: hypothetical protein KatS3mg049_3762 [Caldilinea sp.]
MASSSIFAAVGAWLANGPGILFLSTLVASLVLVWDWRWALGGATVVMLGISTLSAALHDPVPAVTGAQWVAALVSSLLLGLSAYFHRPGVVVPPHSNWLLRSLALGFLAGAWWVLDPGVTLPTFTRVETDLLIWIGLCSALMLGLSAAPFYNGIGLLLLTAVAQNIAAVLLPGSGLAVLIGIAQILLALGCAYTVLAQPARSSKWQMISTSKSSARNREESVEPTGPRPRLPRLFPGRAAQPGPVSRIKEPAETLNAAPSSTSPKISAEEGI